MVSSKQKSSPVPVPKGKQLAEKQKTLLRTMSSDVQQRIERIIELISDSEKTTTQQRHAIGSEVKALQEATSKPGDGNYGERLIEHLCVVFGWEKNVIYGSLAIATTFTKEEITTLSERRMANGRPIPYGHFLALTKVKNSTSRESLINQTIANCWIREELQVAIVEVSKGESNEETTTDLKKEDGRGRPLKPPKDLPGLLRQQQQTAKQFVERSSKVWEAPDSSILDRVKHHTSNECTEEQIRKLWDHSAVLRNLAQKANLQADLAELAAEQLQKKFMESQNGQEVVKVSHDDSSKTPNEQQPEPANLNGVDTEAPSDRQPQPETAARDNPEPPSDQQAQSVSPGEFDAVNTKKQQAPLPNRWRVTIKLEDPSQGEDKSPFREIVYRGHLVVTFKMIDWWHGTAHSASESFFSHFDEFVEGVHYFRVPYREWQKWGDDCDYQNPPIYEDLRGEKIVLTLRGYLLVIKPFQDPRAWDIHRMIVRIYMYTKHVDDTVYRSNYVRTVLADQKTWEVFERFENRYNNS